MKVLFISNDPSIFKEGSDVRARMRAYASAIGELHVLSSAPGGAKLIEEGALTLHPIHGMRLSALLRMEKLARRIIQQYGIEVVSAQDPFEHGWIARKAVLGTGARLHVQVHTDFLSPWFIRDHVTRGPKVRVPIKNRIRRWLADRVLPDAKGIRVVSKRIGDSIVKKYGSKVPTPTIIPIAVSGVVPPMVPLPPHPFHFALITVGRLEPEKRIEDILYALARLGYQHQHAGLIVVGEGSERSRLESLTKYLGLENRVIFTGWIEGEQGSAWGMMRSAQVYIQSSAYEGYGRTLIEAALARVPIITTDVGIVGDVLNGYKEVLATPPGDPANLAAHILGMLEDGQARELFVRAAEQAVRAHLESVGDTVAAITEDLAKTLA